MAKSLKWGAWSCSYKNGAEQSEMGVEICPEIEFWNLTPLSTIRHGRVINREKEVFLVALDKGKE